MSRRRDLPAAIYAEETMRHATALTTDTIARPGCLYMPVASRTSYRLLDATDNQPLQAVSPVQAYADLQQVLATGATVSATGVRGPGDALADAANTLAYLHMVRDGHPELALQLTTIGVTGEDWVDELKSVGLDQVTVLVDTVTPDVAQKLYAWIRPGKKTLPRGEAMDLLVCKQAEAVRAFTAAGIAVRIVSTVRPGVNDHEMGIIARAMSRLGAGSMHVRLASGVDDEGLLYSLRAEAREYLPEAEPEAGLLTDLPVQVARPVPSGQRPNVAVTSSDAQVVDTHLGHAEQFLIYGPKDGTVCLLGTRPAPAPGSGPARWEGVAEVLSDCMYLLVSSAGQKPRETLAALGLTVIAGEGGVDGMVDGLYGGGRKPKK